MENYQRINSQEELDAFIKEAQEKDDSPLECFVLLDYGLRSSKEISLIGGDSYYVYNEIDDTDEVIRHSDLMKSSYIGTMISNGTLYKY